MLLIDIMKKCIIALLKKVPALNWKLINMFTELKDIVRIFPEYEYFFEAKIYKLIHKIIRC